MRSKGSSRTLAGTPSNKGLQRTRAARCAPLAFRLWGQSLKAALAAEPRCYACPSAEADFNN